MWFLLENEPEMCPATPSLPLWTAVDAQVVDIFHRAANRPKSWKSRIWWHSGARGEGLECLKRAENIINREITIFYIEAIPPKKSAPKKNTFLPTWKKVFRKFSKIIGKKFQNRKLSDLKISILVTKKCRFFFVDFWSEKNYFFSIDRPIFFFEVGKKIGV